MCYCLILFSKLKIKIISRSRKRPACGVCNHSRQGNFNRSGYPGFYYCPDTYQACGHKRGRLRERVSVQTNGRKPL